MHLARHAWGIVLLVMTYMLTLGAQALAQAVLPLDHARALERYPAAGRALSMELVFLTSTVNGIFEEVFVAGYIITVLKERRGDWIAINVSTVVRMLYHLYQGPIGIITIVPIGMLYGYAYVRTRQLASDRRARAHRHHRVVDRRAFVTPAWLPAQATCREWNSRAMRRCSRARSSCWPRDQSMT